MRGARVCVRCGGGPTSGVGGAMQVRAGVAWVWGAVDVCAVLVPVLCRTRGTAVAGQQWLVGVGRGLHFGSGVVGRVSNLSIRCFCRPSVSMRVRWARIELSGRECDGAECGVRRGLSISGVARASLPARGARFSCCSPVSLAFRASYLFISPPPFPFLLLYPTRSFPLLPLLPLLPAPLPLPPPPSPPVPPPSPLPPLTMLSPFAVITPALFQAYPSAPDEWTLAALMRADGTLQGTMEAHYDTFITEEDIAQIVGAGLNWVRVLIPFWAVSTWSDVGTDGTGEVAEPFLESVCWKYVVRLLGWARKYGLRVNLDLHTVPGSQNGVADAQRALDYIRTITEFISQPEWRDVVPMFGIVNEALMSTIGRDQLTSNLHAHDMIRGIMGLGAGNGPFISVHDGFQGVASCAGFLPGSDRVILDTHPYFAFDQQPNDAPIATSDDPASAGGVWPKQSTLGVTVAGEFSNGYNGCGLYLTGVNGSQAYGGDCLFALASMDAIQDWFFWTWKVRALLRVYYATLRIRIPFPPSLPFIAPAADGLGLEGGWMPTDPRVAAGKCVAVGVPETPFPGTFSAWQVGGAGAGTIAASASAQFGTWPPATISHGSVVTLSFVTPTPTPSVGDGWFDTAPAVTAVAGCTYPDAWSALNSPAPTALCTGA
ncbi:glycoside hydrolase superfamily [Mycena rosella]|uniref:glucan 1,3-beta-glucosidase n=1 Tax=Mycena rosella TaxID=1033263 RepID=A0AAD7BDG3_MYCRO|nr:glycoside hydrolase superfamily [Mycena rosella]